MRYDCNPTARLYATAKSRVKPQRCAAGPWIRNDFLWSLTRDCRIRIHWWYAVAPRTPLFVWCAGLAKDHPNPSLYIALTHATRYCGLLEASIAADERARRLDPKYRRALINRIFSLAILHAPSRRWAQVRRRGPIDAALF